MPAGTSVTPKQPKVLSTLLVIIASILTFIAILATWVREEALNTDQWVHTSTTIIKKPAVQKETASYLADQLAAAASTDRLEGLLPQKAKPLAAPLQGLAGDVAERTALRALGRQEFQKIWERANRISHTQLVNAINSDRGRAVVLDLRPMLGRIAERTGFALNPAVQDRGIIKVLDSEELGQIRTAAKLLRGLAWWAAALALAAFAAAIAVAGDRRRAVVRAGFGLVLVGLLTLVVRRLGINAGTTALASDSGAQLAAKDTLLVATQLVQDFARMVLALGVLACLAGWILGPGTWPTKLRGWASPALENNPGTVHGVMFGIVLLVLYAGLLPWSGNVVAVIVYVILGALLVELLRREGRPAPPAAPEAAGDAS